MKNGYSQLIQSKYFVTDFNSAIFDGPIRIYFTQTQESLALKVYFHIQNRFAAEVKKIKGVSSDGSSSLFILIYPTTETFQQCFESCEKMLTAEWENDIVIGINESLDGIDFKLFESQFQQAYSQWVSQNKKIKHHEELSL
tara:strand:- start:17803 stop:18225 length:423 start_codon:yes stop_codon:yes gene_type:complete